MTVVIVQCLNGCHMHSLQNLTKKRCVVHGLQFSCDRSRYALCINVYEQKVATFPLQGTTFHWYNLNPRGQRTCYTSRFVVSSLRRGHANLLCIVLIFSDDSPKRLWVQCAWVGLESRNCKELNELPVHQETGILNCRIDPELEQFTTLCFVSMSNLNPSWNRNNFEAGLVCSLSIWSRSAATISHETGLGGEKHWITQEPRVNFHRPCCGWFRKGFRKLIRTPVDVTTILFCILVVQSQKGKHIMLGRSWLFGNSLKMETATQPTEDTLQDSRAGGFAFSQKSRSKSGLEWDQFSTKSMESIESVSLGGKLRPRFDVWIPDPILIFVVACCKAVLIHNGLVSHVGEHPIS